MVTRYHFQLVYEGGTKPGHTVEPDLPPETIDLVPLSDYAALEKQFADLLRRVKEYRYDAVYGDLCSTSTGYFDWLLPEGKGES